MNREATLVFIQDSNKVLLAMKKRGFGEGKWNGPGGKLEDSETAILAAARECEEEVGITPKNLRRAADIEFVWRYNDGRDDQSFKVTAFTATEWTGTIQETEEMKPEWFDIDNIPYEDMWDDDKYWLPKVLAGEKINAQFIFNDQDKVIDHTFKNPDF